MSGGLRWMCLPTSIAPQTAFALKGDWLGDGSKVTTPIGEWQRKRSKLIKNT